MSDSIVSRTNDECFIPMPKIIEILEISGFYSSETIGSVQEDQPKTYGTATSTITIRVQELNSKVLRAGLRRALQTVCRARTSRHCAFPTPTKRVAFSSSQKLLIPLPSFRKLVHAS